MLCKNKYYIEYHAYKAELLRCLDYPKVLQFAVEGIIELTQRNYKGHYAYYAKVARNLMKTKLWKTALKKLKEKP